MDHFSRISHKNILRKKFIDQFISFSTRDIDNYTTSLKYKQEWKKYVEMANKIWNDISEQLENSGVACSYPNKMIINTELVKFYVEQRSLFYQIDYYFNFFSNIEIFKNDATNVKNFSQFFFNNDKIQDKSAENFIEIIKDQNLQKRLGVPEEWLISILKFKNYFLSSIRIRNENEIKNFVNNCIHNLVVLKISTIGHIVVVIINKSDKYIELFDPSYDYSITNAYRNILKTVFPDYKIEIIIDINIQEISDLSGNLDILCQVWILHYIHRRLIIGQSAEDYRRSFQYVIDTHPLDKGYLIQNEIKGFLLQKIPDNMLAQIGGENIHYHKYIKYKKKYLSIKKF